MPAEERQQLLDRLVALNNGDERVRALYASFSPEGLRNAVVSAEQAAEDIRRRGRLGALWQDDGAVIVDEREDDAA